MKITVLDAKTLGDDLDLSPLNGVGETEIYENTPDAVYSPLDTDAVCSLR